MLDWIILYEHYLIDSLYYYALYLQVQPLVTADIHQFEVGLEFLFLLEQVVNFYSLLVCLFFPFLEVIIGMTVILVQEGRRLL